MKLYTNTTNASRDANLVFGITTFGLYAGEFKLYLLKIEIANVVVVQIHLCVPNIAFWVLKSCSHE